MKNLICIGTFEKRADGYYFVGTAEEKKRLISLLESCADGEMVQMSTPRPLTEREMAAVVTFATNDVESEQPYIKSR